LENSESVVILETEMVNRFNTISRVLRSKNIDIKVSSDC